MNNITQILEQLASEKGLQTSQVELALIESMIKVAKKLGDHTLEYGSDIDKENDKLNLYQKIEVVASDDIRISGEVLDEYENLINAENFIVLDDAYKLDKNLEIGDFLQYDMEFEHMGRNASSYLYSELEYRLQKHISDNIFDKYRSKVGTLVNAVVTNIDKEENTFVNIAEVRGVLNRKNRIKGEKFKVGDTVQAVVKSVRIDKIFGLIIDLSRTSPKYLEALLVLEVPELKDNKLNIEAIARIPGIRAKIAVSSLDPNTDPIGSIVGVKGVRINAVSAELNGEGIDCIEYSPILEKFISRAMSPAKIENVVVSEEQIIKEDGYKKTINKATLTISQDEKSKAIGKAGVNIRLAGMLTKCDIDIHTIESTTKSSGENTSTKDEAPSKDTSELEAIFKS
ncbi:MAG: transcription termination/antitermination protein NusA [Epsilonproteobacteria bacterium]|nr:MAG: transcription termination/antitermination protein NusA [Campylobacterota bacterium]